MSIAGWPKRREFCVLVILSLLGLPSCSSISLQEQASPVAGTPATTDTPASISVPFTSISSGVPGEAQELKGAGSTFAAPLYACWFNAYHDKIGVAVGYQGVGSSEGVRQLQKQEVDFGASDAAMNASQIAAAQGGPVIQVPTAFGAIVLGYNLPGISSRLKLTGSEIAAIFLGRIQRWDDPLLVAENPDLRGKHEPIIVIHRADGSGTTAGFTSYLSHISADWKATVGEGSAVYWPRGYSASKNAGIAGAIRQNPYSIGYLDLNFAITAKIDSALVRNRAGQYIDPSLPSIEAAVSGALESSPPDQPLDLVDPPGAESYPIPTATYIIAYRDARKPDRALALARLLWWAIHDGQQANQPLRYARVPATLTPRSEALIRAININHKPVFSP
jgi:phosphate transport system substrate-binding protein